MAHHGSSPDAGHEDYHGHPNYVLTWIALLLLFGGSLAVGYMGHAKASIVMIFALAIAKTSFVTGNFMHLRWEPKLLLGLVGFATLCVFFFYFGVAPDLLYVPQHVAH